MDYSQKKLIVVVGPTAVGKTAVSVQLALHFETEIISADSRQFYKELTIGTAKPSPEELAAAPHHFINSLSIADEYDASRFGEDALALIYDLFIRHDHLVVCGGSGLYIKALLEGFDDIPEVPDEIREKIAEQYAQHGLAWLQQRVKELDPAFYDTADTKNPSRLMRALEVVLATGKPILSFHKKEKRSLPFKVVKIGLELDRAALYQRIDARMHGMIAEGLFDEAGKLYAFRHHNALQTVGYTEVFDFIEGKHDREETVRLLKRNSRRYAKRQLTWFKRDTAIRWFDPSDVNAIIGHIMSA